MTVEIVHLVDATRGCDRGCQARRRGRLSCSAGRTSRQRWRKPQHRDLPTGLRRLGVLFESPEAKKHRLTKLAGRRYQKGRQKRKWWGQKQRQACSEDLHRGATRDFPHTYILMIKSSRAIHGGALFSAGQEIKIAIGCLFCSLIFLYLQNFLLPAICYDTFNWFGKFLFHERIILVIRRENGPPCMAGLCLSN